MSEALPHLKCRWGKPSPGVPLAASHQPCRRRGTNLVFRTVTGEHSTLPRRTLPQVPPGGEPGFPGSLPYRAYSHRLSQPHQNPRCRLGCQVWEAGNPLPARMSRTGAVRGWASWGDAGTHLGLRREPVAEVSTQVTPSPGTQEREREKVCHS